MQKMKTNENVKQAIIRGVSEEIGQQYSENVIFLNDNKEKEEEEKSSYSYPGQTAKYRYNKMKIKIPLLTSDYPPPSSFLIMEKNNGIFKRFIKLYMDTKDKLSDKLI